MWLRNTDVPCTLSAVTLLRTWGDKFRAWTVESVLISAGTVIPAGRKMWTCPWGGAGTRFPDDTLVSLDRSAVVAFTEANDARQIDLKSGVQ